MSTTLHEQDEQAGNTSATIPPLENGDRLTRAEFYERWDAMPRLKKAERIEGDVYMQAAIRAEQHGEPHGDLLAWLVIYKGQTPGIQSGDNSTIQLDPDNDPQPDGYLRIRPEFGGQATMTEGGYLSGAPELIAEVAASSASYDLHNKFHVYRRNGVCEYVVWKVLEHEVVWFELKDDTYVELRPDDNGVFKSAQFPGLWLDSQALIAGDFAKVVTTLQQGIDSREHREFIDKLNNFTPES